MAKLSIIIPACNSERTIEKAILSVYTNRKHEMECIVIVNNCSDNTLDICNQLSKKYTEIIVLDSVAANVSEARNIGLAVATGDIIGFMDSDDYFVPEVLDNAVDELLSREADIIACGFERIEMTSGKSLISYKLPVGFKDVDRVRADLINDPNLMGSVWNKLYRRDVLTNISFDGNLTHCEDTEFNLRVLKQSSLKVYYSEIVIYNYVQNPESASNNIDKSFDEEDKLKYFYAMEKIRDEYPGDKRIYKETGLKLATLAIDNYVDELSSARKEKLLSYIRANIKYLVLNLNRYEPAVNRQRLRKGLKILVKG